MTIGEKSLVTGINDESKCQKILWGIKNNDDVLQCDLTSNLSECNWSKNLTVKFSKISIGEAGIYGLSNDNQLFRRNSYHEWTKLQG